MPKLLIKETPAKPRVRRVLKPKAAKPSLQQLERHAHVSVAAYYLAERRGFEPGCELDDWFMAENMLDAGSED